MAPLFLIQAAQTELSRRNGAVINMVDIHGLQPYKNHSVYCAAKAALGMLTQSMAQELAPHVRVNGIAPGAILWPEDGSMDIEQQRQSVARIPLGRCGTPEEIASLVVYLCSDAAKFITGEIIKVDGGRSI
jgi:pteridine reductase